MRQMESTEGMELEQVILPQECRQTVLHLANTIPVAGHLGIKKTAQHILRWFYWPNLQRDVAITAEAIRSVRSLQDNDQKGHH